MRQAIEELARSAVNTLLSLIAGFDAACAQVILPTEPIVRRSTASPRQEP